MKGKALVVVAILLGVVVVVLINQRFSALEKKANPKMATLYEATADIMPGVNIGAARAGRPPLLKEIKVPQSWADGYPDALDEVEMKQFGHRTIRRAVKAGEYLRMIHLQPVTPAEMRARLPEGHVAASITVSQETAVGFLVAPGDVVDVYLISVEADPQAEGGTVAKAKKVGQDLTVFAVDNILQRTDGVVIKPRGGSYQSVTIASTPQNIEKLIAARALGRLTLVLKGRPGE